MSARDRLMSVATDDMPVTWVEVTEAVDAYAAEVRAETLREAADAENTSLRAEQKTADEYAAKMRDEIERWRAALEWMIRKEEETASERSDSR